LAHRAQHESIVQKFQLSFCYHEDFQRGSDSATLRCVEAAKAPDGSGRCTMATSSFCLIDASEASHFDAEAA
jgi:hypothetical protein